MANFDLNAEERAALWQHLITDLEQYYANTSGLNVAPSLNVSDILALVEKYPFEQPVPAGKAVEHVIEGLSRYAVHTPHPGYYGLFNPRATFPGILADAITATFNPQMAAWSHNPFANEVERYLIREFGKQFGYPEESIDGVFATGGTEANLTAVLCALNHHFPEYANVGLHGLKKHPILYCSAESHHSIIRSARVAGLGLNAVRAIPVDGRQRMDAIQLEQQIQKDLKQGLTPFMIVATAGATGAGAIDPLPEIAEIAQAHGLWLHVDAAYGGAAILEPSLKGLLKGIELGHSITFDAHKWLSAPMGAGMFLTREKDILHHTFRITADYMPKEASAMNVTDPFNHSIQWSRRFIGLKLYLSLLIFGWEGFAQTVRHQTEMGRLLKKLLRENGWKLYNDTDLPIACFSAPAFEADDAFALHICDKVLQSGQAWISVYRIGKVNTLRACITNYATTEKEVRELVKLLERLREGE